MYYSVLKKQDGTWAVGWYDSDDNWLTSRTFETRKEAEILCQKVNLNIMKMAENISLNELADTIHQINKVKGFWDKERNVGELLMLIVGELSEGLEAHRVSRFANMDSFENEKLIPYNEKFTSYIKDTFEDEIADALIRILDMACGLGIDIEKHVKYKLLYNSTRPRLHGKNY